MAFLRKNILLICFAAIAFCAAVLALAQSPEDETEIVPAAIDHVFVPRSLDDNDEAEIVLAGVFRDTCHSIAPVTVEVDPRTRKIHVTARALRRRSPYCMEIDVPYTRKVSLGVLAQGRYQITIADYPQTIDNLSIAHTDNPLRDDFRFAPVAQARVDEIARTLTLEGAFQNTCLELREVRLIRESEDILLVLPIAVYFNDGECGENQGERPFLHTVQLQAVDTPPALLLYIRTQDGGSLARVVRLHSKNSAALE